MGITIPPEKLDNNIIRAEKLLLAIICAHNYRMNMRSYECCSATKSSTPISNNLLSLIKLLSVSNRLELLNILRSGEHCVCQFSDHIEVSQSLISHHLRALKDFGLVSDRKDSKWSYYSLTPKGIEIASNIFGIKL